MKPVRSLLLLLAGILATRLDAQAPQPTSDEIVVTAQRSGIPVWRVRGAAGTLVLVGTIEGVAKGTNWNPDGLAAALRQADQVMFPQAVQISAGFVSIMGAPGKVRRMERLPAGQTLADFLTADQFAQLLPFRERGVLKPGFETRRPLFVAHDLMEAAKGERPSGFLSISKVDWKSDPQGFVRSTIDRYHLKLVPLRKESLTGALRRIAAMPPSRQTPCLLAAARFAQADPSTYRARSQAWVTRRVAEVVRSPAEHAFTTCASTVREAQDAQTIEASLLGVLRQPITTVAVLEISTLATEGGILDKLSAAGFEITGPAWK